MQVLYVRRSKMRRNARARDCYGKCPWENVIPESTREISIGEFVFTRAMCVCVDIYIYLN